MVKLDDVLYARRMTLTQLSERIGITLANLSILKTGKARAVRFSTLEAICEALECGPGDLLEFELAREPTKRQRKQPAATRKPTLRTTAKKGITHARHSESFHT